MTMLFVMALSWLTPVEAQVFNTFHHPIFSKKEKRNPVNDSTLTVSLITCYPGEEIYELCGHSAIRIRGENIDSVWNFGIFDFDQPNFVYRFVKGETDYKGMAYPFPDFLKEYVITGRKVVEQDLNFTPDEVKKIHEVLKTAVLPENAEYRYNYIKDNCSTRILNHMDSAASSPIIYPDSVRYGSFRNEMRAYHKNYPWYQFGIDVALGSGLDASTNAREEMFVPIEMMRNAESAKFADGRPLVKQTTVLYPGRRNVVLPPTPWFLSPIFWAWLLTLAIMVVVVFNIITNRLYYPLYAVWFFILGLAGCLVTFLVFISVHESTSPNVLIFWLNPFQFLFTAGIIIRSLRILAKVMAVYNVVACGLLLILSPFISQSFNPAFFPLLGSSFALAGAYAIIITKSSYKIR